MWSCENDEIIQDDKKTPASNVGISIDASFDFVPVNKNGDNLLQTKTPLTIADFDIVLYDKRGKPYYFYDPMLGDPKRISVTGAWGGSDWVCVYLNGSKDSNVGITYLRICDQIHTIKSEWESLFGEPEENNTIGGGYSLSVKKVWFDNELVYNADESIELVKIIIEGK
jgi:hypothetical protein